MLYELNNTDEAGNKKKKDFYSVERAHKDIIKKANLLKNELEQTTTNDSQISLRKKEGIIITSVTPTPSPTRSGPILERKMSKDSTRSSVSTRFNYFRLNILQIFIFRIDPIENKKEGTVKKSMIINNKISSLDLT